MAETIRDVIIRTRIQFTGNDPMRAAVAEAKRHTDAVKQSNAELQRMASSIRAATDAERRRAAESVSALQKQIGLQRTLRGEVEKTNAARMQAGGAGSVVPGTAGGKGGFLAALGGNGVMQIASAVLTVANAPKVVLGGVAELIEGIKADIAGGQRADQEGLLTKPGRGFWASLGIDWDNMFDMADKGMPGGKVLHNVRPDLNPNAGRGQLEARGKEGVDPRIIRNQEIEKLQELIGLQRSLRDMQADVISKQVEGAKLARQEAEKRRDAIRESIDKAKEEFGMMNRSQQNQALQIAGKVGRGGLGSLNEAELEFARGSSAFRGLLGEHSQRNADASGFGQFIAGIGRDRALATAEADLSAVVKQQNSISITVEQSDQIIEDIAKQLLPLLNQNTQQDLTRLKDEVKRLQAARFNQPIPNH